MCVLFHPLGVYCIDYMYIGRYTYSIYNIYKHKRIHMPVYVKCIFIYIYMYGERGQNPIKEPDKRGLQAKSSACASGKKQSMQNSCPL